MPNGMVRPVPSVLEAVWGSGPNDVYAVGWNQILRDNGTAWSRVMTLPSVERCGIWGTGPNDVYAVGEGYSNTTQTYYGVVLHYDGLVWSNVSISTTAGLHGIWGSGPGDIYVVGHDHVGLAADPDCGVGRTDLATLSGVILHYNGFTWSTVVSEKPFFPCQVWGSGPGDVYVVGRVHPGASAPPPALQRFDLVGHSRLHRAATPSRDPGSGPDNVYVVGGDYTTSSAKGLILHFDGFSWSSQTYGTVPLDTIWGSGPDDIFAAGYGTMLHYPNFLVTDTNNDGAVDVVDLLTFVDSWGSHRGGARFDAACDFNHDTYVDVADLLCLVETWGQVEQPAAIPAAASDDSSDELRLILEAEGAAVSPLCD